MNSDKYSQQQKNCCQQVGLGLEKIPVLKPRLPPAESILPYLHRIDEARVYSNFGPLALELEQRLCDLMGIPGECTVTAASGYAALVAAILGTTGRASQERPEAIIPAFTFVATASAVEACGFQPRLSDVEPDDWLLSPGALLNYPGLARVGLVVPVAALGRPIEIAPWLNFQEKTGIPVVIDGAASFGRVIDNPGRYCGFIPVAISFHATKGFSSGEGGCVISTNHELALRVRTALNLGFPGERNCQSPNINGKMSEYHAAVGLAELDNWHEKLKDMQAVVTEYRNQFVENGMNERLFTTPLIGENYVIFQCNNDTEVAQVTKVLDEKTIDYRRWYGRGIHTQSYYVNTPVTGPLNTTDRLSSELIGLPFSPDLSQAFIARVVGALTEAIQLHNNQKTST